MSALSLADVRWRSRRGAPGAPPAAHVAFLSHPADRRTTAAVAGVADYLASHAGRSRRDYDGDVPAEIAGDRRLGRALAAVCMDWYRWTARDFDEALPEPVATALRAAGIATPSALRLRLFDVVNGVFPGFVPSARRDEAMALLSASLSLPAAPVETLDTALTLDAEDEAILRPLGPAPSVRDMIARYNRAALAAMLRQAERIIFTVHAPDGGLLRRLYAICRRLGVYCDVEQADALDTATTSTVGGGVFRLTLSGPDAVVGPPAAAGSRLATVALRLLGQLDRRDQAVAHLVLHERSYLLALDDALLRVPGLAGTEPEPDIAAGAGTSAYTLDEDDSAPRLDVEFAHDSHARASSYDSEVEARMAREFAALRRQGRAGGWRLVREPAPLLAGGRVLIPDFALDRGDLRVFVEVAGFWTPGYIARKRQSLEQLSPDIPLVLVVAEPLVSALTGLPFPVVPYRESAPVHAVLEVAERRYGDFAARTRQAGDRVAAACATVGAGGWLSEAAMMSLLGCHSAGEITRVLSVSPAPDGWEYVAGAGLAGPELRRALCAALEREWAARGTDARLTVADVRACGADIPVPAGDDALAALLERLPACTLHRGSLFDVQIGPPGTIIAPPSPPPPSPRAPRPRPARGSRVPARPATRML